MTRRVSDQMIKDFIGRMKSYADVNDLGKPTLLFAETPEKFGVALHWPDDRRAFAFSKRSWSIEDYQRLCNALRAW